MARHLDAFFRRLLAVPWVVVALYALLLPLAVLLALRVESDHGIDRLIVPSDPEFRATRAFQRVFPERPAVLLAAEAADPFAPAVQEVLARVQERLRASGMDTFSALDLLRAAPPGTGLRALVTGTDLFRRQGLAGPGFLAIAVTLPEDRDRGLALLEDALGAASRPGVTWRRLGGPYVDAALERATERASLRAFPLFGLFVIGLVLFLYRSARTLAAILLTLAACVGLTVGVAAPVGWTFTIVSSLVPLTVLVTATSTLVYVHSRYLDGGDLAGALVNKFTPCTASIFAAAVGFAALAVSRIRPIREMGLWTATGLLLTWVVVFTLYPALVRVLRIPPRVRRPAAAFGFDRLADRLPAWSWRHRGALVGIALALCAAGAVALRGMRLQTDGLDYLDPGLPVVQDARWFERTVGLLDRTEVWVTTPAGAALDPRVLRGLDLFGRALEREPGVAGVIGPTTALRWMRYLGGGGDVLPDTPAAWAKAAGDLEALLLEQPALRGHVDVGSLSSARLTILGRSEGAPAVWAEAAQAEPALARCAMQRVGEGVLQAGIAAHLVPTLTESFFLTAAVIFVAFLLVFRSGAARVMAMLPSLVALLVTFLLMRLVGIPLNIATILIASTVLGASENDQIHFFYHFQEGRRAGGTTEQALRHTLRVAGRAIVLATVLNAGGFLALALSDLPPMRQFGMVSATAFLLSMAADFTALPAALWIVFRDRPDARRIPGS
ncbi:MAG TPA: MMPL family transporter [Candidatus Polarisedimenticolaceae bacterium]|nr:MMPL family transporter [Candidatus Polarisedimenticolaceae bacterium]